jgi:hypothetical protein
MKVIILFFSLMFPENSFAGVENLEELIQEAEASQYELAVALKVERIISSETDMQQNLPRSQVADAEINIKLKMDNP